MNLPTFLSIDVGTSSTRAAVIQADGQVQALGGASYTPETPQSGWCEQNPEEWWKGACSAVREALDAPGIQTSQLAGIAVCGQMHSPVPLSKSGEVLLDRVQLWNDKRPDAQVRKFLAQPRSRKICRRQGNPAACSWSAFKLAWMRQYQPSVFQKTWKFLTPKDFINYRLTGVAATDFTEASGSFFCSVRSGSYDEEVVQEFGVHSEQLPEIRNPEHVLGGLREDMARELGLPSGLPVVAGCGDFPASLLGSGVCSPGESAEITGTSTLLATLVEAPSFNSRVGHIRSVLGGWIQFAVIDAGGESIRWARNVLGDASRFADIDTMAASIEPGCGGLLFLPYLNGERLGGVVNSRAQFFGITAAHSRQHCYRSVMEGVAFAARRSLEALDDVSPQLIASGGGARSDVWLNMKASVYQLPLRVPENTESGLLGAAILAGTGVGCFSKPTAGVEQMVRIQSEYFPDPELVAFYERSYRVFEQLYQSSQALYGVLDTLHEVP
jgi:sugar (pentulose or hexulose) kinase